jgi:eukaryotic-like serine/threonine-protein kinase
MTGRLVRAALAQLLLASAVVAQGHAPGAQSPPSEWRSFRGGYQQTGNSASPAPSALKVLWSYDAGETVESTPAIADGVVYIGGGDGELIALDLASGAVRWRYKTAENLIGESSPAVANGTVYVGDLGGILHAVNAADGRGRWTFKTGTEIKSSPTVAGDVVLIGSYDGHLYALDARSGRQRWKFLTNGNVHATPAVSADGLTFVAGCDGQFRAIRISDGREVYKIDVGAYTGASPIVVGDRAYFGTFENEVLGLDLKARTVLWRFADPDRVFPFYSSPALFEGKVIVGGRDKLVRAIDAATGKQTWMFAARARVDSSPVIAAGRVYVGASDSRFYVLDAATGNKLFEFNAGAAITGSAAIAAGKVVVGTTDGTVYAFQ